jgi:hypothetical protein
MSDDNPVHVFVPPPMPPEMVKIQWSVYAHTIRHLLPMLLEPALRVVRMDLREGDWRVDSIHADQHGDHEALLNDVTEALIALDPSMRLYYEQPGKGLLPSAPVDASALLDGLSE